MILERDVETYLVTQVMNRKGMCLKLLTNYEEGLPDRLVILPGNRIWFCELKRPKGGRLSPLQVYQHKRLTELGCTVRVLKNKEAIDQFLSEMDAKERG